MEAKSCNACQQIKPVDDFGSVVKKNTGTVVVKAKCKSCEAIWANEYYRKKRESKEWMRQRAEDKRGYYAKCKLTINTNARRCYVDNPERYQAYYKKQYSIAKETLSDTYVKHAISRGDLSHKAIPQPLIELKRAQLTLHRLIHQTKHGSI